LCQVLTVNDISEQLSVSVFPNPNNGHFTLSLSSEKGRVEIYNTLGMKVCSLEITSRESGIDLSGQPAGLYFVKISSGQTIRTEKILVR